MKWSSKKTLLVILTIITISMSTISLVGLQFPQAIIISGTDLAWTFSEGDDFSFSVNVTGSESSWYG